MSIKDSSKTGNKSSVQLEAEKQLAKVKIERKVEEDLVFGKNPHLGGGKFKAAYPEVPPEEGGELKTRTIATHYSAKPEKTNGELDEWKWTFQGEPPYMKEEGIKEKDGKVTYNEIDWDFIDDMSNRMDQNTKYPPLNYQKGMDVVELAKAVLRHARKIVQPIPGDPETIKDHIEAIGTNAMMMNYQVKEKVKEK